MPSARQLAVTDDDAFDTVLLHHLDNFMHILFGLYADHVLNHVLRDRCIRGLRLAVMCQVAEQGIQGLPEIVVRLMSGCPDGTQEVCHGYDADQKTGVVDNRQAADPFADHQMPGRLFQVRGGPEFIHPAYMVFPREADSEVLGLALHGLRELATEIQNATPG